MVEEDDQTDKDGAIRYSCTSIRGAMGSIC